MEIYMKKIKITYKEIADMINKTEAGIKYIKKTNPKLLNILKLGCLCKKKNISFEELSLMQ